jgi:hypothetical protein
MPEHRVSLSALAFLERQFDGPIPATALRAALAGGADASRRLEAARALASLEMRLRGAVRRLAAARRHARGGLGALVRHRRDLEALYREAVRLRAVVHATRTDQR